MRTFRIASYRVLIMALVAFLLGAVAPATLLAASTTPNEHPLLAVQAWPGNGCSNYSMPYGQSSNPYSRMPGYSPYSNYGMMYGQYSNPYSRMPMYNPYSMYGGSMPCRPTYPRPPYYPRTYVPPSYYPPSCVRAVYTVRPGDDLFRIGLRYGVSWVTLAAVNGIRNPNFIFWGMRLAIPCSNGYAPPMQGGYSSNGYPSANSQPYQQPQTAPAPQPAPGGNGQSNVTIMDFSFNPGSITVAAGQTVVWMNNGPSMHTTTSDAPGWDSGAINPGQTFSHAFTTAGTFTYHCSIHPTMHGTVVVTQ